MSAANEWDIVLATSSYKVHIFERTCNVFLLRKHTDDGVFYGFPKISQDFPKFFRRLDERCRRFSENFRKIPKISEDFRRFAKSAKDYQGRPGDVSMIHQLF